MSFVDVDLSLLDINFECIIPNSNPLPPSFTSGLKIFLGSVITRKSTSKKTLIFILVRYIVLRTIEITQVECARVRRDLNDLMVS